MEGGSNDGKISIVDATRQDLQREKDAAKSKVNEMRQKFESMRKRKLDDDVQVIDDQAETSFAEVSISSENSEDNGSPMKKAKSEEAPVTAVSKLPSFTSLADAPFKPIIQPEILEMCKEQHSREIELVRLEEEDEPVRAVVDKPKEHKKEVVQPILNTNGDPGKPLVKIMFFDPFLANAFGKAVRDAVAQTLSITSLVDSAVKDGPVQLEIVIRESDLNEENTELEGQIFTLDTEPAMAALRWKVPSYSQTFKLINGQETEMKEEPEKKSNSFSACFNCSGNHMISECPQPIDHKVVNENRAKFRKTGNQLMKTSRYHVDDEQKYQNHRPGHLSDELRHALGLLPNQLPLHTYCMRIYGYPPGWLEEAKVKHSGISLIEDVNSNADTANGGSENDVYDVSKIVDYPGFNVPCRRGTIDETIAMGMPPMDWNFSKEAMLQFIGSNKSQPYIKQKQGNGEDVHPENVERIDDEDVMILENRPDTESSQSLDNKSRNEKSPESPDIEILEANKKLILEELGENTNNEEISPKSPENAETDIVICVTPEKTAGRSMSSALGTPVIESSTPFGKLPTAEKFSQGVSEHLNFENLPGATGKYQRMKGIINKVKQNIDDLHNEGSK